MIRLQDLQGHNDVCGGYCYEGCVSFDGTTVKEVLEEIRDFAKDCGDDIGEGFGKKGRTLGSAWGIRINGIQYVGDWCGWTNDYKHEYDDERVIKVTVSGGWYCFYDFDIICDTTQKAKRDLERKITLAMFGLDKEPS